MSLCLVRAAVRTVANDLHALLHAANACRPHLRLVTCGFNRSYNQADQVPSSNRDRDAFLMHVHADIFTASHRRGAPFWRGWLSTKTLLQKGRPFILSSRASGPRNPMKISVLTLAFDPAYCRQTVNKLVIMRIQCIVGAQAYNLAPYC